MPLRTVNTVLEEILEDILALRFGIFEEQLERIDEEGGDPGEMMEAAREADAALREELFADGRTPMTIVGWLGARVPSLIVYGGDLTPEDLIVMFEAKFNTWEYSRILSQRLPRPRGKRDGWSAKEYRAFFGFDEGHVEALAAYLLKEIVHPNGKVHVEHSTRVSPQRALEIAMLRLRGLQWKFVGGHVGHEEHDAMKIGSEVIRRIGELGESLTDFNLNHGWAEDRLKTYVKKHAVYRTDHAYVWGTIDGTTMHTSRVHKGALARRTGQSQWASQHVGFSGHHQRSELTWLSITTPDGMTAHVSSILLGGNPDHVLQAMRDDRGVEDLHVHVPKDDGGSLKPHVGRAAPPGRAYDRAYVFGDQGFTTRGGIIVSNAAKNDWLGKMYKAHRVPSEWDNRDLKFWHSLEMYPGFNKVLGEHVPLSNFVFAAYVLKNIRNCLYGSETAKYFDMTTPQVSDYLAPLASRLGTVPQILKRNEG